MCIVGDVAIESPRAPLFAKEVKLVVSRSYGPGRYDPTYETLGIDYPAGYVRWTEGRNLDEVLRLMATGQLRPSRVTSHTFDLDTGTDAYALLESPEPSLGIAAALPGRRGRRRAQRRACPPAPRGVASAGLRSRRVRIGVIGAGAFARSVLMPPLSRAAPTSSRSPTATGVSARSSATRFGASLATTDAAAVLGSSDVDAVVIATRHDTHAEYVVAALEAGKHVFVEKPLALSEEELVRVEAAAADAPGILMVGIQPPLRSDGRRAARCARRRAVRSRSPTGSTPAASRAHHWTRDPLIGGGRIVGEGCHFVDLASFLATGTPTTLCASGIAGGSEPPEENVAATLSFPDGSIAQIVYAAYGDSSLPKERVEVLGEAGAGILDDFRELRLHRDGSETVTSRQTRQGARSGDRRVHRWCRSGEQPWPIADMAAVMRATFAIRDGVRLATAHEPSLRP